MHYKQLLFACIVLILEAAVFFSAPVICKHSHPDMIIPPQLITGKRRSRLQISHRGNKYLLHYYCKQKGDLNE